MSNIITANDLFEITGITAEEVGEEVNSTTRRDKAITDAQFDLFRDASREYSETDPDYGIAQRCVAFLTAHLLAMKKKPLVTSDNTEPRSPHYYEYKRLLGILTKGAGVIEKGNTFQGEIELVTSQETSADYVEDMTSE